MGVHIKSVFEHVERGWVTAEQMKHGLSYAQYGDCMDNSYPDYDWNKLNEACMDGDSAMIAKCRELTPKYIALWEKLGEPRHAQEWIERSVELWRKENADTVACTKGEC